jgi:glycosyltransferase involved in cell wall biosynthesis
MRILVLLHDAFGGRGGIAKFNRDFLTALCLDPRVEEVVCLPRIVVEDLGPLPAKLDFRVAAAGGKGAFFASEMALLADRRWFDLIVCGHLRLLPLIRPLELRRAAPLGLILHGVDAWDPFGGAAVRRGLARLDWFLAVSRFTRDKFIGWTGISADKAIVVPNTVDLDRFTPGPKPAYLAERYGLAGRTVLMGMARLDQRERYKGFDEVIEALPRLAVARPDIAYLVCGDGTDRARLEAKARTVGVADRVVFAGWIDEAEKVDHYRLADCFLLAGWGEGFGIVLIEAMACGVPAIASNLDASAEAVGEGRFGLVVNPKDQGDLVRGIEEALARPRPRVPDGLDTFADPAFRTRVQRLILDRHMGVG